MNTTYGVLNNSSLIIDTDKLRENVRTILRSLPAGTKLIPVVKDDAYGMGMVGVARTLSAFPEIGCFAVANVSEGVTLRREGIRQDILLEVNIGSEEAKTGFAAGDILPLIDKIDSYPNICVRGLMAIPPISRNPGDNLKFFLEMRQIYVDIRAKKNDNVSVDCLSMGMSGDFADAIRAGSTMIRVGTAIFGARSY